MANVEESRVTEVDVESVILEINNPSQEMLVKVIKEIPIIPKEMEISFIPKAEINCPFVGPFIRAEFESFMQDGIFKLRDKSAVHYGREDNKEEYFKNVQDINKRIIDESKPDVIKYTGDSFGFNTFKDTILDSVIKAGYKMEYFHFNLAFPKSAFELSFWWEKLRLKIWEDERLRTDNKSNFRKWFKTLEEPQQK